MMTKEQLTNFILDLSAPPSPEFTELGAKLIRLGLNSVDSITELLLADGAYRSASAIDKVTDVEGMLIGLICALPLLGLYTEEGQELLKKYEEGLDA